MGGPSNLDGTIVHLKKILTPRENNVLATITVEIMATTTNGATQIQHVLRGTTAALSHGQKSKWNE